MPSADPARADDTAVATLETDERSARRIADGIAEASGLGEIGVSLVDGGAGRWLVTVYLGGADRDLARALVAAAGGRAAAQALRFARIAATDWVRQSLAELPPVRAGRFIVHGAHDRSRVPANRIGIEIEAALAFGTGHHGSTRGCLLALDGICKELSAQRCPSIRPHPEVRVKRAAKDAGRGVRAGALRGSAPSTEHLRTRREKARILDLGTGSGVLAIAAARALQQRVVATDIDAAAVHVARANIRLNRAGALVAAVKADGPSHPAVRAQAPFDLVFANILLGPLQRMAAPLMRLAAPGARIVLSGLLPAQANAALAAYRGLALERRIDLDGWTTLVLRRS
jgi:ribosomal protein L11 methyltransferase